MSSRQYHELRCQMVAPKGITETFAFFENPRNLARITPPWLGFVIRTPEPVEMGAGAEIDYTIRWLGLPMSWKTLITEYEPPERFVDVQARGPYSFWEHTHTFRAVSDGTLVTDHVKYALPFGPLGRLAERFVVSAQLRQIFRYRQEALARILGGSPDRSGEPVIRLSTL